MQFGTISVSKMSVVITQSTAYHSPRELHLCFVSCPMNQFWIMKCCQVLCISSLLVPHLSLAFMTSVKSFICLNVLTRFLLTPSYLVLSLSCFQLVNDMQMNLILIGYIYEWSQDPQKFILLMPLTQVSINPLCLVRACDFVRLSTFCQCVPAYSVRASGTDLQILLRSYNYLLHLLSSDVSNLSISI